MDSLGDELLDALAVLPPGPVSAEATVYKRPTAAAVATERVTLGEHYRDTLTDYAGVAIARTEFLYGSPEVKLQRLDTNGAPEEFWFDEARLVSEAWRRPVTGTPGFGPPPQPR